MSFRCDRCKAELTGPFWHMFTTQGKKRKLHFCSDKCRVILFKGKGYWSRSRAHQNRNEDRIARLAEKCL